MPRRTPKAKTGTVAAGREVFRLTRPASARDEEFEGEAIADDPVSKGAAMYAASRGNRSAYDALRFAPDDDLGGDAA